MPSRLAPGSNASATLAPSIGSGSNSSSHGSCISGLLRLSGERYARTFEVARCADVEPLTGNRHCPYTHAVRNHRRNRLGQLIFAASRRREAVDISPCRSAEDREPGIVPIRSRGAGRRLFYDTRDKAITVVAVHIDSRSGRGIGHEIHRQGGISHTRGPNNARVVDSWHKDIGPRDKEPLAPHPIASTRDSPRGA